MSPVTGIDHVVINATDLEATCAFYDRLFGITTHAEYAKDGKVLVRQVAIGGALLSVHQQGNGVELVAKHPTVGGGDICFRWDGDIQSAIDLLKRNGITIIAGPARRRTADGRPSKSVYFRDVDDNLLELMAAD
jgi:catechol 2,3-dioxygenase-like lactoylglutathione lyase family enzyme